MIIAGHGVGHEVHIDHPPGLSATPGSRLKITF